MTIYIMQLRGSSLAQRRYQVGLHHVEYVIISDLNHTFSKKISQSIVLIISYILILVAFHIQISVILILTISV